jgi:acyl-CoA synthetase (AMP-forming)/AMP-acid ligase II
MHPDCPTLIHVVRKRAADTPDAPAIIHEPSQRAAYELTYLELWQRANAVAAQLAETGERNDRVVLLFPSGPEFAEAFLGCLIAGRVAVPAAVPRNERAMERTIAIVQDSGAHLILTSPTMLLKLEAAFHKVRFPNGAAPSLVATDPEARAVGRDQLDCTADDIAFLQYTSGSTTHPRGVVVGHDNLMDNLGRSYYPFEFDKPAATMVNWLPAYHDMGLIGGLLEPLYSGCKTVLMSPSEFIQRPLKWLELITKHKGTISGGPNFAYDACVARIPEREFEALDLSSWRVAFNGSEPIRAQTLDRFAARFARCGFDASAIFPCYGLAESTLMVTGRGTREYSRLVFDRDELKEGRATVSATDEGRTLVGCGPPNEEHDLAIVNPQTKQRCAENEIGEIWLSGPSVCKGYWKRDEETRAIFSAELEGVADQRFLRTGDLGVMRDGQLYISGRLKNIVIIRGLNYACEDIEDLAQASHRAVTGSPGAAFGVEGATGEELVIAQEINTAYITEFGRDEVTAAIQESIVLHHGVRARDVILVEPRTLPRTTSGKLQRHKARDSYAAGKLRVVSEPDRSGVRGAPSRAQGDG